MAGAGMAGLSAAARARELGARVLLLEKGDHAGGSMALSSGVIWRHRDWARFRAECPGGEASLQRLLWDRLEDGLRWLESLGAPVARRETGNPLTTGLRFEPGGLRDALLEAAGGARLSEPVVELPAGPPVVLATGGFQADRTLVAEHVTQEARHLLLRASPWSSGDGMRLGLSAGGALSAGLGEFYGRNMPAPPARIAQEDFVSAAQLYARHARVRGAGDEEFECRTWSEIDVVQWTARQPRARAWYEVPRAALGERVGDRSVAEMVATAERAGAPVERRADSVTVEVVAGITTTLGGLRIDERARVSDGVYACGADAGGMAGGGYLSGLAAALVFGRIAAESALAE